MTKQTIHTRTSKKGKKFVAGSKKMKPPEPAIIFRDMAAVKKVFKTLQDLTNEAEFKLNKSALTTIFMDPANVCMVDMMLEANNRSMIAKLSCCRKFALNLKDVYLALRDHGNKDIVKVYFMNDRIIFQKPDLKQQLPEISIEEKENKVPDLNFEYTIIVKSKDLYVMVLQAIKTAESIDITGQKNRLHWKAQGDIASAEGYVNGDVPYASKSGVICRYSLEYLKKAVQLYTVFPEAKISFHNEYPLKIEFYGSSGKFTFILAPRVINE